MNGKIGKFIVLEGVDASGKSTQLELLEKRMAGEGYDVIFTREPGGTPYAERIRELILDPNHNEKVNDLTEFYLYMAARAQHVHEKIIPAFLDSKIIICSRFIDSTFAYQITARGLPEGLFFENVLYTLGNFKVDHTFFLDVPEEVANERMQERGELDRLEKEDKEFRAKCNNMMRWLSAKFPEHTTIDGTQSINEIHEKLYEGIIGIINRES